MGDTDSQLYCCIQPYGSSLVSGLGGGVAMLMVEGRMRSDLRVGQVISGFYRFRHHRAVQPICILWTSLCCRLRSNNIGTGCGPSLAPSTDTHLQGNWHVQQN